MGALLDVALCKRRHLMRYEHRGGARFGYEEATITCTQASGIGNAKVRAKALWAELKRLLRAGKFAAVQARELWSTEEQVHMRPGHFWACELGDADGKGSPILAGPFDKQQYWPPNEGEAGWETRHRGITRRRYDAGDCALLVRCYFHRTADDPERRGPHLCALGGTAGRDAGDQLVRVACSPGPAGVRLSADAPAGPETDAPTAGARQEKGARARGTGPKAALAPGS